MSGSARVVERLKTLYESNRGDVEFDDDEDIIAVTGLLKLFLRELPDSVIPADVVRQFLQVQAGELFGTGEVVMLTFTLCIQCIKTHHDLSRGDVHVWKIKELQANRGSPGKW